VCENYGLDETQKLMYLHNLVRGSAKRFYLTSYIQTCRTYIQAVGRIATKYNSPVKQNQIHNKLTDLRLRSFVVKGMKLGDALTETYRVILKLSRWHRRHLWASSTASHTFVAQSSATLGRPNR